MAQLEKLREVQGRLYPEAGAGGFSRVDGTVEFYGRVSSLLPANATVIDFGAGRGQWLDDTSDYRRSLRDLRGPQRRVIGVDVDDAVLTNPSLDEAHVIRPDDSIPVPDGVVDVLLADYVLEHIADPAQWAAEIHRVLKPGGWFCARTPTKWGYVGIAARLAPNQHHVRLLTRLQPARKAEDVFPVRYELNSLAAIRRHFPATDFENCSYTYNADPAYFGASRTAWRAAQVVHRLTPPAIGTNLFVFVRKWPSGR